MSQPLTLQVHELTGRTISLSRLLLVLYGKGSDPCFALDVKRRRRYFARHVNLPQYNNVHLEILRAITLIFKQKTLINIFS